MKELIENNGESFLPNIYIDPKDYTVRKKLIWKGKMAKQGYFYLVIKVKNKNCVVESWEVIQGAISDRLEALVCANLREGIYKKYGF